MLVELISFDMVCALSSLCHLPHIDIRLLHLKKFHHAARKVFVCGALFGCHGVKINPGLGASARPRVVVICR